MKIEFIPIGIIHTPFKIPKGMPIQPPGAEGITGSVEVYAEYQSGLNDLDGFSHIILLYSFHRSKGFTLDVVPYLDTEYRGVFATRAPRRPNSIGLSIVKLEGIKNGILQVCNVDILDGTPLLDIKPYVPEFDQQADVRTGWLEKTGRKVIRKKADDRFE
jgi:tRNA-Thr(GGU) m(6)t(6)A37 methyltransferase TsaA